MQKHQTTETVTKLKDGESTGWIKVIKKPTSKTNVVSQASRLVTKPKPRVTLKQSSLSEFFQLENRIVNNHLSITKEVNISRQDQVLKPPEKKQSSRKRKDVREETTEKNIKQGQSRQITLKMCFGNNINFYAQLRITKEKSNTSKISEKRNNRVKKAKSVQTKNVIDKDEKVQKKLVDFFLLKNQHINHSQNTLIASELQNLPNSASVNGSTALDNQQMPLYNSYHLSNLSVLTDDSFITTSSRISSEITPDRHTGKSSKHILCDGIAHDKDLEKNSSAQNNNTPLQNNVNTLLEMDGKRSMSVQNNSSLVAASKSVIMVQTEILDILSTRIIGEMDNQNELKEILRPRTPDSIQERLIKSGISPAPSPPSLLSQDSLEQIPLSILEQLPSINT
ncbi:6703_t:CDS:2, partial [Racocetra fulgida]